MQATIDEGERVDFSSIENLAQREFEQLQVPTTFTFDASPIASTLDTTASSPNPETVRQYELDQKIDEFMEYYNNRTAQETPEPVVEQQGFFSKVMDYASHAFSKVTSAFGYSGLKTTALAAATVAALAMPAYGQDRCGDADENGYVNILDALAVAQDAVGLPSPLTEAGREKGDVSLPIGLTIIDALYIAQNAAGLPGDLYCSLSETDLQVNGREFQQFTDTGTHVFDALPQGQGYWLDRTSNSALLQNFEVGMTGVTASPRLQLRDVEYRVEEDDPMSPSALVSRIVTNGAVKGVYELNLSGPLTSAQLSGQSLYIHGSEFVVTAVDLADITSNFSMTLESGMQAMLNATPQSLQTDHTDYHNISAVDIGGTLEITIDYGAFSDVFNLGMNLGAMAEVPSMPGHVIRYNGDMGGGDFMTTLDYCRFELTDTTPGMTEDGLGTQVTNGNVTNVGIDLVGDPGTHTLSKIVQTFNYDATDPVVEEGLAQSILQPREVGVGASIPFYGTVTRSGGSATEQVSLVPKPGDRFTLQLQFPRQYDGAQVTLDLMTEAGAANMRIIPTHEEATEVVPGGYFLLVDSVTGKVEPMQHVSNDGINAVLQNLTGDPSYMTAGSTIVDPTTGYQGLILAFATPGVPGGALRFDMNGNGTDDGASTYLRIKGPNGADRYLDLGTTTGGITPGFYPIAFVDPAVLHPQGSVGDERYVLEIFQSGSELLPFEAIQGVQLGGISRHTRKSATHYEHMGFNGLTITYNEPSKASITLRRNKP